ncbi:MAG: hypothetical protein DMF59_03580 [Acidobacteria bacterium]|nr:MAG: hypothetical protein DMF59_03580 [Acidobacteriota bacterium]
MTALAFALITILALAMFARPLFRGEVLTFRDHSDYFQPLHYFTADELRHSRLPLWNPYNASGEPWLANPQTGIFYPPAWIFLVLPFATAYVLFLFLHVVLLGCGAFLLFSRIGSPRAAFIGALMLMLFGPTLSMLDISNNLTTFAWLPLVLWCAMSDIGPMFSASAIAMSFLAGEPFFAAAGAVMFALIRRKNLVDIALTAFFLASVQLIPFLAIIAGSDRAGNVPREEVLRDSMSFADWLRTVIPGGMTHQQFIPIVYLGIVPALLALMGIWDRRARGWLLLLAFSIVISAGSGELLTRLPLTIIRYPARVVPLGGLAIAALAVIGLRRVERFSWIPLIAIALIIVDLIPHVAPLLQSAPFNPSVPYSSLIGRDGKIARLIPPKLRALDRRAWIAGYLNLFERRFDAWTAAPIVSESYTNAYADALQRRDLLDRMSIAYVLTSEGSRVVVHRNPNAIPMAYWRDPAGHIARASVLAMTSSAVHVIIDAPSDGIVVITQQFASGWSVDVDKNRATPELDGVFRAVRVRAGHHAITWRYRPRALIVGIALTMIAILRMLLSSRFVKRVGTKNFFSRNQISLEFRFGRRCRIALSKILRPEDVLW